MYTTIHVHVRDRVRADAEIYCLFTHCWVICRAWGEESRHRRWVISQPALEDHQTCSFIFSIVSWFERRHHQQRERPRVWISEQKLALILFCGCLAMKCHVTWSCRCDRVNGYMTAWNHWYCGICVEGARSSFMISFHTQRHQMSTCRDVRVLFSTLIILIWGIRSFSPDCVERKSSC